MQDRTDTAITSSFDMDLLTRVRSIVQELLKAGTSPVEISFAFAFVATELGLALAPHPVGVFPIVLNAVAHAASASIREGEGDMDISDDMATLPADETIH